MIEIALCFVSRVSFAAGFWLCSHLHSIVDEVATAIKSEIGE